MSKEKNDILRNGSGYCDYTAYAAIMNYGKGEKKMEIKAGEIYEVKRNDGSFMTAIIIAVHEYTSNILFLCDTESEGAVKVICKGEKYTDVSKLQYIYNDKIRTFVRKMKDEEFAEIMGKVAQGLAIKQNVMFDFEWYEKEAEYNEHIRKLKEEQEGLIKQVQELQSESGANDVVDELQGRLRVLVDRVEEVLEELEMKKEQESVNEKRALYADFYKEMYESLLEKVIA